MIRDMIRIAPQKDVLLIIVYVAVEDDVLDCGAGRNELPLSRGCPVTSDIWEDATMQYRGSSL